MTVVTDQKRRAAIQDVDRPPGTATSYVVSLFRGEKLVIPCSNSVMRLLVTGRETGMTFAVVSTGGSAGAPIGFHYHREAHDVFLCLKGNVNVWANDTARTMGPGDFASVPPGTIHQYQILGDHTEFIGLIVPGGWEEFFRIIGDPYSGAALFPVDDEPRDPRLVLVPRLVEAAERCDMVPVRDHPAAGIAAWGGGRTGGGEDVDSRLPDGVEPYFLRADAGPKWLLGGTVARPLITTVQASGGRFSVVGVEGGDGHGRGRVGVFAGGRLRWKGVHHCFLVVRGRVRFGVGSRSTSGRGGAGSGIKDGGAEDGVSLAADDTVFIPAGEAFEFAFESAFAQMYVFANGGGVAELVMELGRRWEAPGSIPERPMDEWRMERLMALGSERGFVVEA
ncbi:cupin domain-containing protein [Diplodia corticola]|uniref:Cupin domain-containing protein n=1 Tax=Diplodia corticola TaxID=236234 RepID=A0A1J9QJU5_9PEZI|nr:cupin domain-containing protein [Diplodia corticola]OJD29142.1 cupin domain-containing protein [Diplodia corticola]